jgi:hypothetical protein
MSLLLLLKQQAAAVATTNDLRSAIAHLRPYSAIQPIPGSNAQERRQLSGWIYTGIPAAVAASITPRPLGLSPWVDFAPAEPADDRRARVRSQRERMGILEVVERFDAQEASRVIPTISRRESTRKGSFPTDNLPPAPRSQNGTAGVLSLQAAREAQADRARLLAVLEAMEARKQIDIRRRMALLLLAAEA